MKFAHIADIHIKNLKHHNTYEHIFGQLYNAVEKEEVDCIVCCGDIAHTKTNISPEFVEMASRLFNNLADIAPLYIILGNHDGNLKNADRQDAITPIVEAINNPRIKLLKNSGEFHINEEFCLNVLSIFDRDNWIKPTNPDKINIALYHGAIQGAKTDTGWAMKDTDDNLSIFEDFDYGFLGDIHKQQFLTDRVAYCGSTIQQNFGEEINKGILVWTIKDKKNFSVKPVNFQNPSPFITCEYSGVSPVVPAGSNVRIVLDKYYDQEFIEKLKRDIQLRCNTKSILIVNKHAKEVENKVEDTDKTKLNLRDNNVQQDLIKEFLSSENLTDEQLQQVLDINTKFNLDAEIKDETARNVKWELAKFEWDNLFNYKEGNKLDFSELSGIVGIFGKNYSGKSSVIDSLLYTLFNTTSKNIRKNFDVINERKNSGKGRIEIKTGNGEYVVLRETEKNIKKSKGKLVEEGKTSVDFEFTDVSLNINSLNGNDRNETDKNIRKEIGTYEDFCNTSLSTQHGSLDFINEGSARRKEILANFLDLQIFENKYKPANQYANELKSLIKKLEIKDYSKILGDIHFKHHASLNVLSEVNESVESLKQEQELLQDKLNKLTADLAKVEDPIDIEKITSLQEQLNSKLSQIESLIGDKKTELKTHEDTIAKINEVIERLNVEELKKKQETSKKITKEIDAILYDKKLKNNSLSIYKKSAGLIETVPCGKDQYKDCSFKKNAYESLEEISIVELALKSLEEKEELLKGDLLKLDADKVNEYLDKYSKLQIKSGDSSKKVASLLKELVDLQAKQSKIQEEQKENEKLMIRYESNRELYENIGELEKQKESLIKSKSSSFIQLKEEENRQKKAIADLASIEQQIDSYEEQIEELNRLKKEYSSYELFLKCTHNSGIPFELIKRTLPIINEEINSLLANIVEFEASFQNEDGKLEIYIKHPNSSPRAIENCSGAEKSLVAMAIRLALIKCGSLPVSDLFILDEPATSLDADHLESFIKVLEMIKTQFKLVLLITHLDTLKDSVDKIIEINKDEEGFAYFN